VKQEKQLSTGDSSGRKRKLGKGDAEKAGKRNKRDIPITPARKTRKGEKESGHANLQRAA